MSPVSFFGSWGSDEFVLLFPHHENGAWRGPYYLFGRASDAKMFPAGVAVRRDDDEIDIEFLRGLDDLVRRQSGPDSRVDFGEPAAFEEAVRACRFFFAVLISSSE